MTTNNSYEKAPSLNLILHALSEKREEVVLHNTTQTHADMRALVSLWAKPV